MSRLETDLRNLFLRNEEEAPLVDLGEPERMARRTRRRQVLVAGTTALVAVALVAGAVVGIGALVQGGRSTPAQPAPPDAAPVVIERGSIEGWDWVLSASEDGRCVALTDVRGSTTICPTHADAVALPPTDPPSTDLVGVAVRSPGEGGPDSLFVFGIVSPRIASTSISDATFRGPAEEATFLAPPGIDSDRGFFVGRYNGYPYPIVPAISVLAIDDGQQLVDWASVPLPEWAKPPHTVLEVVATGTWASLGDDREWSIQVWRSEFTDQICYGVDLDEWFCGPAEDPLPGWSPSRSIERANTQSVRSGGRQSTFIWGLFTDPVVDIRVTLNDGRTVEPEIYGPPSSYPDAPRVFIVEYRGKTEANIVGLDADGNVVHNG